MKLISIKETAERLSIGRTKLWHLSKEADFPKPVSLGPARKAYVAEEIDQWIQEQMDHRDQGGAS